MEHRQKKKQTNRDSRVLHRKGGKEVKLPSPLLLFGAYGG